MVDYFKEGHTINDACYAEELRSLSEEIVKKVDSCSTLAK